MVAMSMPAALSAVNALGGARNVNSFAAAEPPVVIAVSRFTIVRSALRSTAAAGPNTVFGSAERRAPTRSMKWTSPAKDMVNSPGGKCAALLDGFAGALEPAGGAGASVTGGSDVEGDGVGLPPDSLVHAASSSAVASAK